MIDRTTPFALLARNNAWANETLVGACLRLGPGEWDAQRTSFFPSIRATMEHIHAVDLYYLDAATGGGRGPRAFREAPRFPSPEALAPAQAALDARLVAFCDQLTGDHLGQTVVTDRGGDGRVEERLDRLLLHLFQHQIHHRGQVHAMLSGTSVTPPQLDDFFLDFGRVPSAEAWQ
jgi:uncharacterized damage-inducible protein DinB